MPEPQAGLQTGGDLHVVNAALVYSTRQGYDQGGWKHWKAVWEDDGTFTSFLVYLFVFVF